MMAETSGGSVCLRMADQFCLEVSPSPWGGMTGGGSDTFHLPILSNELPLAGIIAQMNRLRHPVSVGVVRRGFCYEAKVSFG